MSLVKPVFLLSDSSLLFWQENDVLFASQILTHIDSHSPKAAYLGASNGDIDEYFQIFESAMSGIGVTDCMKIHAEPSEEEVAYLKTADVILLAGGDVFKGMDSFVASGIDKVIKQRYQEGAVLIGVSAGAIQLGQSYIYKSKDEEFPVDMLNLVPMSFDAHDEDRDWVNLKDLMLHLENKKKGIGIPKGAGFVYHSSNKTYAVRFPSMTFVNQGINLVMSTISPNHIDIPVLH